MWIMVVLLVSDASQKRSSPERFCEASLNGGEFSLIHPDRRRRRGDVVRPHAADAVPWVLDIRPLALALVALGEARHEELLGEGGEQHPTRLAVRHFLGIVVEIDHLGHGARLGGMI